MSLLSGPEFFKLKGWWLNSMLGRVSKETNVIFSIPSSPPVFWSITYQKNSNLISKIILPNNCQILLSSTNRLIQDCRWERQALAPKWDRKYASELKFAHYGCLQSRPHKDRVLKMSWRSTNQENCKSHSIKFWDSIWIRMILTGRDVAESTYTMSSAELRPMLCVSAACWKTRNR